jgi:formylglycine-generating enzyme required for sulfatase activity
MKNLLKMSTALFALLFFANTLSANNVRITGTAVSGSNVTFSIAWDNSWYANVAPANNDAVWLFVKYQDCATQQWAHAGLSTVVADHTAASPLVVETVADGKGVFLRRGALGGGNIAATTVTLKMTIPAGTYNYKVFGVEMVKVLQDTFQLGDGVSSTTYSSITINAARQGAGISGATLGNNAGVAIPATYPMGYNAFYCMKNEISQQQYVDFLNSIQYRQQEGRTTTPPNSAVGTLAFGAGARTYGNGIVIQTPGSNSAIPAVYGCDFTVGTLNDIDDAQNKPANYLSWGDLSGYLDWAALRPMTEMEYEKVCRGPVTRVANEFAWGTTTIAATASYTITNLGAANEGLSAVANGICNYYYSYAPMRVGFAATSTSGRVSAGAAYYGAMEMTGNVWEQTVSTYNAAGATFTGDLGDGDLTSIGQSNTASWPDATTGLGAGIRGGGSASTVADIYLSARGYTATPQTTRTFTVGGRGVR